MAKEVLAKACAHLPELSALLAAPIPAGEAKEILSPDGLLRGRIAPTTDHEFNDVDEVTIHDAATGTRMALLQLRDPGHRLVRFLGPRRLLLVGDDGETFFELDFDAAKPRRQVLPGRVRDEYGEAAPTPVPRSVVADPWLTVLTAEESIWSMFVWFWIAGLVPLLPATRLLTSGSAAQAAQAAPLLAAALAISWGCVLVGQRKRVVAIDGGDVVVRWGERLPLTLWRGPAREFEALEVERERRVALTARSGGSTFGTQSRPDRFRLRGLHRGKRIDLGTHATEDDARRAIDRIAASAGT